MKNVVKCYKDFFGYFNALKTHSVYIYNLISLFQMLTSASSPIIGPETHPDGDSGGGSGAVTSPCGGGPQPIPNQPGSDRVNVKNNTLVILNSSTCTLKLQSTGSGPFSQKKKAHRLVSSTF